MKKARRGKNPGTSECTGKKWLQAAEFAGKNAVRWLVLHRIKLLLNNYLSQKQQAQKEKEIAECQTLACKAGAQAKWTAIDLGQDGSFAAGMVVGVPAGLYDAVDSIVKTASSPVETY